MPVIDDIIACWIFPESHMHGWKYILWTILAFASGFLVCGLLP